MVVSQKQKFSLFSFRWSRRHGNNSRACSVSQMSDPLPVGHVSGLLGLQSLASHPVPALATRLLPTPWVLFTARTCRYINWTPRLNSCNLAERLQTLAFLVEN